jgi:hypothetical protein
MVADATLFAWVGFGVIAVVLLAVITLLLYVILMLLREIYKWITDHALTPNASHRIARRIWNNHFSELRKWSIEEQDAIEKEEAAKRRK